MPPTIQDTLLDLFDRVQQDPDVIPTVPMEDWQESSVEWRLLAGFQGMLKEVQQRMLHLRQMEQQLREREEQYRAIFEATIDGLSINDLEDGRVIVANPALCEMFGYTYEEFIDLPPTATIHPDTFHVVAEVLQKVQRGTPFQTRFLGMRKDGSVFHAEGRGTPFMYKGKPHLLGSTRDITEQVRAEQELREKEEQYRSVFEATDDGLDIADLDGFFVEANPAYCRMLGYTREELIGMHFSQTTFPEYYPILKESTEVIESGGQYQAQGLARRKDGSPLPVEAHATPFIYRGKQHMLGVMRDITERVEAEKQLREKEKQYRSVFEATYDGLIISNLDGFIVEVNPAFCQMYGYTRDELIGLHVAALAAPESLPVLDEVLEARKTGRNYQTVVAQAMHKDGTAFYVESHGTTFTYKSQPHTLGVVRDITERVEAERQLREKEGQYRSIFEAVTDSLTISSLEDGQVVEANPATCKMLGYSYDELIGKLPVELVPPDYLPLVAEGLQTLRVGGRNDLLMLTLRKDGTTFPTEVHSTLFNYKGRSHLLTVSRDITERVQAEEQIREREEQYRSVFEATYDALFIMDLDGFLVEVNPAFCSMFGYPYEEIIGLQASNLTAPESLPNLAEALKTLKSGRGTQTEMGQGLRKNGTTFYSESQSTTFTYLGKPHALGIVRDITDRVETERQLREREEQYRSVFEASTDGLFIQELEDGRVVEVNPAACDMHGFTHEEFIGLLPTSFIHPDSFSLVSETLQTIQGGGQYHARGLAKRKDGTPFNAEAHVTTFTYKDRPHLLSIVRDITEQIQAEEQLREKEEQYRSVFEATSDGLIIRDMDGYVVEANPAAYSMHGYTYEEFLGLHRSDIIDPKDHAMVAEYMKAIQAGHSFLGQAVDLRKDGTPLPVEVRGTTFTYQGKPHTLSVLRDITERVEAEQQLREKEEQYRAVFEATTDGLVILDPDGFYVEANPAMSGLFGYTHEELIGLHTSALTAPESLDVMAESLEKIKGGIGFQEQGLALRKDGTVFYAEAHLTPFTYQGKPHLLAATHDITEQVHAQQLLEQRVEERTRELSSLLEISHTVASTLQLKPLLGLILDQLKTVVDYTGAAILAVENEDLIILDNRSPIQEVQLMQLHFPLKDLGLIWETMISRETIIMPDVRDDTILAQAFRAALRGLGETIFSYVRACMIVPLSLKEQVAGMLVLTSSKEEAFTPHHSALALAIANQAAVAIENARLYEQAQALAAFAERQRLARELHDSVSQALYGISLGVHTARMQLDRNPQDLVESLDYVLELAEAALIEMRALIFELRPESLETEGLVTALTKQAAALQARQGIIVQLDLGEEPDLPLKVKQDLYRVVQEALHNTVKHARASQVELRLNQADGVAVMEVRDNGRGFDATASFPGHLGLHSMQERVKSLGGELTIESAPGQGTCISAKVPVQTTTNNTGSLTA